MITKWHGRRYDYEYGTNPRKIESEIRPSRRRRTKKTETTTSPVKKNANQEKAKMSPKKLKELKIQKRKRARLITYICIGFAIMFAISYRNSQIDGNFGQVQKLKKELSTIQKENDRLEISIENSLNLNNIEKAAMELLGMQRLTNKQRVYIELPKEDFVQSGTSEVIQYEEQTGIGKIVNKIKGFFDNI